VYDEDPTLVGAAAAGLAFTGLRASGIVAIGLVAVLTGCLLLRVASWSRRRSRT
jgi:hypothetical protein